MRIRCCNKKAMKKQSLALYLGSAVSQDGLEIAAAHEFHHHEERLVLDIREREEGGDEFERLTGTHSKAKRDTLRERRSVPFTRTLVQMPSRRTILSLPSMALWIAKSQFQKMRGETACGAALPFPGPRQEQLTS